MSQSHGMDATVASWAGLAIFLGPIVAGIALMFLRWQLERGPWWTWLVLLAAGGLGYYGYQQRQPSPVPTPTPVHHRRGPGIR